MRKVKKQNKCISMKIRIVLLLTITQLVGDLESAWSFASQYQVYAHENITRRALEREFDNNPFGFIEILLATGNAVSFSEKALDEIIETNRTTDEGFLADDAKRHFDDELLVIGSLFLKETKEKIIGHLTKDPPDAETARDLLGKALHALQDYYSHTNWSEVHGFSSINTVLGRGKHPAPPQSSPCPEFPAKLKPGLTEITSGWTLGSLIFGKAICQPVTLEDFTMRCIHGDDIQPWTCDGLNKDFGNSEGADVAFDLAVAATRDFVQQIFDAIPAGDTLGIEGNTRDRAIGALMDQDVCYLPPNPTPQENFDFCSCVDPNDDVCICFIDPGSNPQVCGD